MNDLKTKTLRNIALSTIFNLIDKNNDGTLSKKEIMKALSLDPTVQEELHKLPGMSSVLHPSKIKSAIKSMDKDNDGKISKGEFCSYINQVADDLQYEVFHQRQIQAQDNIQSNSDPDSLPDLVGLSIFTKWIRTNGRGHRIALDLERKRIQRKVLETFCRIGFSCSLIQLDMARLHVESMKYKKLIEQADLARSHPNILDYYATKQQNRRKEEQKKTKQIFNEWKEYTKSIINGTSDVVSISYWSKYLKTLEKNRKQEEKVLLVLTDDLVRIPIKEQASETSCNERRKAMALSVLLRPSLISSTSTSNSKSSTALVPLSLRRRPKNNVSIGTGLTSSASVPMLGVGRTVTRTWRKRTWLPNDVTLESLRPVKKSNDVVEEQGGEENNVLFTNLTYDIDEKNF